MPDPVRLGDLAQTLIGAAHFHWENAPAERHGRRRIMGYALPPWQRGLVWTDEQNTRFLESAWRGLNLGTYTVNQDPIHEGPLDYLLIDGQQRMNALERYFSNEFPVFGYTWDAVTDVDRRGFLMSRHFASYITNTDDEAYLREYYNLSNFGGTPHDADERA